MVNIYIYVEPDGKTFSFALENKKLLNRHYFLNGWFSWVLSKPNLLRIGEKIGRILRFEGLEGSDQMNIINGTYRLICVSGQSDFSLVRYFPSGALNGDQLDNLVRGIRSVLNLEEGGYV